MAFTLTIINYNNLLLFIKSIHILKSVLTKILLLCLSFGLSYVSADVIDLEGKTTTPSINSEINTPEETPDVNSPIEQNRLKAKLKENPWMFLLPFKADYEVHSDGDKLGSATRQLQMEDGVWKLQMSTKLKKWLLSFKNNVGLVLFKLGYFNRKIVEFRTKPNRKATIIAILSIHA